MKKYALFVAAGMVFFGWKVYAGEIYAAPGGKISNPINADYGGVEVATMSGVVGISTVPSGTGNSGVNYFDFYKSTWTGGGNAGNVGNLKSEWRIYGVSFSSGNCGANDSISIFTSTIGASSAVEKMRFYNVYNSTFSGQASGSSCSGIQWLRWPVRVYGNLFWQSSNPNYLFNQLFYWKEPEN